MGTPDTPLRSPATIPPSGGASAFPPSLSVPAATIRRTNVLGGTMRRRVWIILSTVVVTAIVVAGSIVWFNAKSYNDTVASCARALEQRADGDSTRPAECEDVTDDDYDAMAVAQVLKDSGVVDEDGNVDLGRVLDQP